MIAAKEGHKDIVELLITNGANVNAKDSRGETPLDWAGARNQEKAAQLLRKHGGKHSSIHTAVAGGDIEAVKEFLADGADVNAKNKNDKSGWTPLLSAVIRGHKEMAGLLIAEGADANAKDDSGWITLDHCANAKTADLLRKHGGKTGEELDATN